MALPDTGCTRTLVRVGKLDEHNIRRYANTTDRPCYRVANDNVERSFGTLQMSLQLGNNVIRTEAVICSTLPEEIVLSWQNLIGLGVLTPAFPTAIYDPATGRSICNTCDEREADLIDDAGEAYGSADFCRSFSAETHEEDVELTRLVTEFRDVFDEENLKPMNCEAATIHIDRSAKNYKPLRIYQARRVPIHYQKEARKALQWYLDSGILKPVSPSKSTEWCSPGFFVPKPNGKVRLVIDYRVINKFIDRPAHPFMSPLDIVHRVKPDSKWFIKADAVQGFFQIPLDEASKPLTTFLLPEGRFMFTRMPMGMNNSSDVFCARTDEIFDGVPDILKIVDDTLIQARTRKDALAILRDVLQRCKKGNLTLSRDKLRMGQELPFAGFIIGKHGVKADPKRTDAIRLFPPPKDQTGLRSFLGLAQQLGFFIPDLAHLSEPLRKLLKKNTVFIWHEEHQKAFEAIKVALTSDLVVKAFNPSLETHLLTDASRLYGIGFALLQQPQSRDKHQLIQCGSRCLIPAETRYATNELEMLAIAWAVESCKHFLLGCKFHILTDHRPLVGTFEKPLADILNPRLMRFRERLMPFSFDVTWTPGKSHLIADALSRAPLFSPPEEENEAVKSVIAASVSPIDPALAPFYEAAASDRAYQQCIQAIKDDVPLKSLPPEHAAHTLAPVWHKLSLFGNTLLLVDGHRIVVPRERRAPLLEELHAAHPGIARQKTLARRDFYWPTLAADVENYVSKCDLCQTHRPSQSEPLKNYASATQPMQTVSIDMFEWKNTQYLIMVDRYSLFTWVHRYKPPARTDTDAIVKSLMHWFQEHGLPKEIVSDNGPQFRTEFNAFCVRMNIVHTVSSPYNSQSNGLAESAVKSMKSLLKKCESWTEFENRLLAWRDTPSADSKISPAEKFYGRRIRTMLPRFDTPAEQTNNSLPDGSLRELQIGEKVRIQNAITKLWDQTGKVLSIRPNRRSYLIERDDGSPPFVRNRRFLKALLTSRPPPKPLPPKTTRASPLSTGDKENKDATAPATASTRRDDRSHTATSCGSPACRDREKTPRARKPTRRPRAQRTPNVTKNLRLPEGSTPESLPIKSPPQNESAPVASRTRSRATKPPTAATRTTPPAPSASPSCPPPPSVRTASRSPHNTRRERKVRFND